jgi:phage shock protein C
MVAGVCGGLAATYGWDLPVVRLITALCMIFSGSIIFFAYIVAWVVVPEEPYMYAPPIAPAPPKP